MTSIRITVLSVVACSTIGLLIFKGYQHSKIQPVSLSVVGGLPKTGYSGPLKESVSFNNSKGEVLRYTYTGTFTHADQTMMEQVMQRGFTKMYAKEQHQCRQGPCYIRAASIGLGHQLHCQKDHMSTTGQVGIVVNPSQGRCVFN